MTADIDLSPEAVERLVARLDRAAGGEVLPTVYLGDRAADWCAAQAAATLRALSAENAAAREALAEAAGVLRMMTDQDAIKSSTVANAYACCVSAEAKARKVLGDQNPIKKNPDLCSKRTTGAERAGEREVI